MQLTEASSPATAGDTGRSRLDPRAVRRFALRYSLVIILALFLLALALSSRSFLTVSNLNVILIQVAANALLATGAPL